MLRGVDASSFPVAFSRQTFATPDEAIPSSVPGEIAERGCHESRPCRPQRAKKSEDYFCMRVHITLLAVDLAHIH